MILQNRELKNALIKIGVPVALQKYADIVFEYDRYRDDRVAR